MKPFVFKIGGEAGFGITSAGVTFAKIVTRMGYSIFNYMEYPSLIRGGHNVVSCTISDEPVHAPYQHTDFLIALNQDTIKLHQAELCVGSVVLYDQQRGVKADSLPKGTTALAIPFAQIATDVGKSIFMRDTVALAAALAMLGGDVAILKKIIAEEFEKKGAAVVALNQAVAEAGFQYVQTQYKSYIQSILKPRRAIKQLVLNANEAVALGAVAAGLQFAAIYPMTPTSNILHVLAPLQEKYGFIYKQPEDEISAINMAIGASFAGARSMVATAGGGFCLMTEAYGLAGMTETPLVIIEGMRGGPATGLPTWTEQGDLRFVLHAHQGDFPRIVLAAGDVEEAFKLTMEAFNLADVYQTPVVVMVDKHLCESHESIPRFKYNTYKINRGSFAFKNQKNYERYATSADGISLRIPPGTGSHVIANSDEHNAAGYSNEESKNRLEQMQKRMQKLVTCEKKSMPQPALYGPADAELTIVSWGSNKGAILEALKNFSNVNFLHLTWLNPFPSAYVAKVLGTAKRILNIECNYSAQMSNYIAEKTGIRIEQNLLKYDGRPIYPEEISTKVKELIGIQPNVAVSTASLTGKKPRSIKAAL